MQAAPGQSWSAELYDQNARFVSDLGADVLAWLHPQPGETVLDLGCGDGALTEKIVAAGSTVVGVDASEDLVASAKARGLDARLQNGEALSFDTAFDAVFSNAALHWMTDPDAVIAGVARALKPGGRFVAEMGGQGNVAAISTALRAVAQRHRIDEGLAHPWYFPAPDVYQKRLERAGFAVTRMALIPRPTPLPTGVRGWVATFREPFFAAIGDKADQALDEVEALLAPALRDEEGRWTADYVRLRLEARAP